VRADGGFGRLTTDRLDLRAVDPADLEALHRICADPDTSRHIPAGLHQDLAFTRDWIERTAAAWRQDGLGYWTVRLRADGAVIGLGGAHRRPKFWNLYYRFDPVCWGRGYATELVRAAQRAALALDPDLPLVAWVHTDNAASEAVAERAGLKNHGFLDAEHWKGEPMRCYADREPAF
jgi:RimJ/RimL family protein N-acetyltransferase